MDFFRDPIVVTAQRDMLLPHVEVEIRSAAICELIRHALHLLWVFPNALPVRLAFQKDARI